MNFIAIIIGIYLKDVAKLEELKTEWKRQLSGMNLEEDKTITEASIVPARNSLKQKLFKKVSN